GVRAWGDVRRARPPGGRYPDRERGGGHALQGRLGRRGRAAAVRAGGTVGAAPAGRGLTQCESRSAGCAALLLLLAPTTSVTGEALRASRWRTHRRTAHLAARWPRCPRCSC